MKVDGIERPLRLAFLMSRLAPGGAELQMIALARGLTSQGFRVDFVCRAGSGPLDSEARAAGARVRVVGELSTQDTPRPTRFSRLIGRTARWVREARREQYDIVDAWMHPSDYVAALTRPLSGVPVVMSARLDQLPRVRVGPATQLLNATVNRLTDAVVANAEIAAADVIREQGVPPDRVRIIRGGVELPKSFTDEERRAQRAALGASDDHFVIGCVGNFRSMKRQDLLIEAFAQLLPERPDLRLVLVGDGPLRAQIEAQIERLDLGGRVTLLGFANDLPPLYDAFDLFVQASNSEALPNVLLEAAAASLPIVATAAGGTREFIHDGETGLLVPVDDLPTLATAVRQAVGDAALRLRLGTAARSLVEREYGMDRFVREYAEIYREQFASKTRQA